MARGINKVILIGNLGADPELRYTGNGTAVCNIRLATNESYKDAEGNMVEKTEWHTVIAWGRLAEICSEYLKKGSQAYFEGSLQTRSWEDQTGNTRYATEIKAREMMILTSRGGGGMADDMDFDQRTESRRQAAAPAQRTPQQRRSAPQGQQQQGEDLDSFGPEDDLPF